MRLSMAAVVIASALLTASSASAQEGTTAPPTELPEPRLLQQGERAPFVGELMLQSDFLQWANEIERLTQRLSVDVATERARCDVRLELEVARTTAASATAALREGLYRERVGEVAQRAADEHRRAERQWWESPVLWLVVGLVVGAAGVVIAVVAGH